jgi:hypothetical protein
LKAPFEKGFFESKIIDIIKNDSRFGSIDVVNKKACTMEGVVCRNTSSFAVEAFKNNVFKYVRKGHVKTDEHWTRNWKRARLKWETEKYDA